MVKGYTTLEVEQVYTRSRELCQQVGGSPQLFSALFGLWRFYNNRAELRTAHELGEECFALAQRLHNAAFLLQAHFALGVTLFHLGEFASALAHLDQGISLYNPQAHYSLAFLYGTDPGVACRSYAARALWFLGYPDQAIRRSHEALTLAQQCSHASTLGYALHFAAALHVYRREVRLVQELAEALITLSNEHGFARWLGSGMIRRGWALAEQGAAADGIVQLGQGLAIWQAIRSDMGRPQHLVMLAEVYGKGGEPEAGLTALAEAMAVVSKNGERDFEAELYRLKGKLLLQVDKKERLAEAEESFLQALHIARQQGAKSLELRAATSLGHVWHQHGKCVEARQILGDIYGWFTEGFDTPDLLDAKALLEVFA